jgi:hypothetical protein
MLHANAETSAMFAALSDEARRAEYQTYVDVMDELEASGELIDSKAVVESDQKAVLVGSSGIEVETLPGPDRETLVTGYYLVDVADEARAIEIAARFPEARVRGGVRVARGYTEEDFESLEA